MARNLKRAAVILAACISLATQASAQGQAMPPAQVGVIEMQPQAVPRSVTLPGRAVAYQQVDIRPRIGGVIEEILYKPGATLDIGSPLFRVDDAAYRADVAAAKSALVTAEANLPVARSAYDRAEKLAGRGFTEAEVDTARATLAQAEATLDAARAALKYAETQLSWATITSPIKGVADVPAVSVGDLVTAGQSDALTTVTQLDPIDVDMLEASARMLTIREEIESGVLSMSGNLAATLVLENGQVYRGEGQLVTPGNTVSTSTGSFSVRFRFDNPDRKILPGMFLRGEITLGTTRAFLVPQRAATRGNSGDLTAFIIGPDGTAQQVTLTETGTYQNNWVVSSGLSAGDRLIVDGLKSMAAGKAVVPVPASISAEGLVIDQPAAAAEKGN